MQSSKMSNKGKIGKSIVFAYLGIINFLLLLALVDILIACPKFCISLICYGELFTNLSISADGILLLFVYYLFVCSNTIWGYVFYKSKYIVCLLLFQILYFLTFCAGLYFNILYIRHPL